MPAMTVPDIKLNDGTTIPQLGFGVFQVKPEQTQQVVEQALEVGYRHLDTAQMYRNEEGVGRAIAASGVPRDELYVTTKLNNGFHRPDDARRAFGESLARLGLDQVDLFLIHWPLPTRYDGDFESPGGRWRVLGAGGRRPRHVDRRLELRARPPRADHRRQRHVPVVNQVEVHPYFSNEAVRAADASYDVATEAWSPIAQGRSSTTRPSARSPTGWSGRPPR